MTKMENPGVFRPAKLVATWMAFSTLTKYLFAALHLPLLAGRASNRSRDVRRKQIIKNTYQGSALYLGSFFIG